MDSGIGIGVAAAGGPPIDSSVAEAIRRFFRDDPSRMTMMAARKFQVAEQAVLDALAGQAPVTRLDDGCFRALMDALPTLGPLRVFVRSRAAVVEVVGAFGGYSETGPFLNVQTDTIDMHILPEEVAAAYAVEKPGHDGAGPTHSFQFFDHAGDAAFKVFLWDNFPDVPPARVEAFRALVGRFSSRSGSGVPGGDVPARPGPPGVADRSRPPAAKAAARGRGSPIERLLEGTSRPRNARAKTPAGPRRSLRLAARVGGALAVVALLGVLGYWFIGPLFWVHYEHKPDLAQAPKFTEMRDRTPGHPLNIGLVASKTELLQSLAKAEWQPANLSTYTELSGLRGLAPDRPNREVEGRFLKGQPQDLAFKRTTGGRTRLLRLWRSELRGLGSVPLWVGTVSVDRSDPDKPGTHASPDIDGARDDLIDELSASGLGADLRLKEVFRVTGSGPTFSGRTASGDAYFTDGELTVGRIADVSVPEKKLENEKTPRAPVSDAEKKAEGEKTPRAPVNLPSPLLVRLKDWVYGELGPIVAGD